MALTRQDKDNQSFTEVNGQQARRVTSVGVGNLLEGLSFDYIARTEPSNTTDVFTYRSGGASGSVVATITVVYTDSSKNNISTIARA